jgi:hypothetical protein
VVSHFSPKPSRKKVRQTNREQNLGKTLFAPGETGENSGENFGSFPQFPQWGKLANKYFPRFSPAWGKRRLLCQTEFSKSIEMLHISLYLLRENGFLNHTPRQTKSGEILVCLQVLNIDF